MRTHRTVSLGLLAIARRPTAVPQVTFSDRLTLELGGTVLELTHVGKNHSDNIEGMYRLVQANRRGN